MRIGLVQVPWGVGEVQTNLRQMEHYAAAAAAAGCEVVVFPELSDTRYLPPNLRALAGCWPDGALQTLQNAARRHQIGIIAGLSERHGEALYSAAAAIAPDGSLCGHYRKTHLFRGPEADERQIFCAGDQLCVAELGGARWGLSICFDLRFPEVYRPLALAGAQILVVLGAWPTVRIADWSLLCRARALENQTFLVGVNHAGANFGGQSCVVGPDGAVWLEDGADGLLLCTLDLKEIPRVRAALPVLAARHTDLAPDA